MTKDRVPYYKKGELKVIYKGFPKSEKKIIEDFLKFCSISAGERKQDEIKRSLTQFRDIIDKNFDKITLEDLRDFLMQLSKAKKTANSSNEIKSTIKRFLKWKFKDWSKRFNDLADVRLLRSLNEQKINKQNLVTQEDLEKMVEAETRLDKKAFLLTLYESGARPQEIRLLKWKDISLNCDGDLSEVFIYATKTKRSRSSFIKGATRFLLLLKRERNPREEELIFPSPTNKEKELTKGAISLWLKKLSKKALGREVNPYMLRHSRATELYLNPDVSDSIAQKFLGHSKNMKDVYTHLDSSDVKESLAKTIYNFEALTPIQRSEYEERIKALENWQQSIGQQMLKQNKDLKVVLAKMKEKKK